MRATGIGCYFDGILREMLSLPDARFQDLYRLALGRLSTPRGG